MRRSLLAALTLALVGCSASSGPAPVYAPDSGLLTDAPWPTDDRLVDGRLDLSGYPDGDVGLLETYVELGETLEGWGTNAPVYFPFEVLPEADTLPSPQGSLSVDGGLFLVDVDPDSPNRGERVPVQWERVPFGTMVPHPVLAVAPVFGFPLRPETTYAAVLTTAVAARDDVFADRLGEDAFDDLVDVLDELDVRKRDVAVATVFTTRDTIGELGRMVASARALDVPAMSQSLTFLEQNAFYRLYEGSLDAPLWQHGEKPYATEGGEFRFDASGAPELAAWESLRLSVTVPRDLSSAPPTGFPIVVYAHGTGGDYLSATGNGTTKSMALAGAVTLSFDQPLHGSRGTSGTNPELHSFNYFNPAAARANFRQGGLDILWLVDALKSQDVTFTTPEGDTFAIDSERILYVGHSHGGLTGAIAAPWLGDSLRGAVLSGAGGGLAITIVKRKDPLDIAALIKSVLGFGASEEITPLHPIVGTVQMLVEETDPMNYAPYWYAEDAGYSATPLPVLLTSGQFDAQTDHETAEALAAAGRLPRVAPAWNDPLSHALRDLPVSSAPAMGNAVDWSGAPITAALSQWEEGDHFVIFDDPRATRMVQRFVETCAEGEPMILP